MEETNIQQKEQIAVHSNPTRYQHLSDASDTTSNYAESITPNMGIQADDCLRQICDRMVLVAENQWFSSTIPVFYQPTIAQIVTYTPLIQISFPDAITNATSTFIRDKLRNWKWFHADIEITVKVNATKFQQGALWIRYNPRREELLVIENNLVKHTRAITSFPGQILNLIDSDSVTLKFPYCSEYEAFDLTNVDKQGSFGSVQIDVLSPLVGATTSEICDVTVYAKFNNVKVFMPTIEDLTTNELSVTKGFIAHSASRSEESVEKSEGGIVSLPARAVAAVSDAVGLIPIPGLQMFCRALGWVSRRVEDVALAHGLSKPEGVGSLINISNHPCKGMNHVEGLDNGVNLGIIQDNEIEPFQSVVAKCDEMSFRYIASRPWVDNAFTWDVVDARGALLVGHSFSAVGYTNGSSAGNGRFTSTGQFLTLHHKLWHSSVKFTLKAVCTFAHSGRLQVMVVPLPAGVSSLDSVDTSLAFVWDIRDQTEMSFTVPWMSNLLWETIDQQLFRIDVRVLNELKSPATVSNTIDILMFASFGDDYEVAIPYRLPISGYEPAAEMEFENFIAHSGGVSNLDQLRTEENFKTDTKDVGCVASIGEQISSVRQLIKRNVQNAVLIADLNTQIGNPAFVIDSQVSQGLPSGTYDDALRTDLVGSFARIYRFWAGSLRYKFFVPYVPPSVVYDSTTPAITPVSGNGYYSIRYADEGSASSYFHNAQINPCIEFTVPFYSNTRKQVVGKVTNLRNNNTNISIYNLSNTSTIVNTTVVPLQSFTSAGDDFNFHFLVGPPVVRPNL